MTRELVSRLREDAASREGWPDDLEMEAADAIEQLIRRNGELEDGLKPFAEVADWAERNGHDLRDFDMLLRGPQNQIAGHLQVQADDFIKARAVLEIEGE